MKVQDEDKNLWREITGAEFLQGINTQKGLEVSEIICINSIVIIIFQIRLPTLGDDIDGAFWSWNSPLKWKKKENINVGANYMFSIQSSSSSTSECWWCWTNLWNGTNRLMSNYLCQSRIQNQDPTSECWCHWYQCLDSTSPLLMKSTICWFCISYLYFLFVFLYFVFLYVVFSYFGHCWWVLVPLSALGFLLVSPNYQLFADVCISYLYFVSLYFCILATVDCWCHYQHLDSSLPLLIINCHLHFHQSSSPPI